MQNQEILTLIRKTKVDALYAMKSYYNASARYENYNRIVGSFVIALSAIVGTSIFVSIAKSPELKYKVLAGLLAIAATVLSSLQTFLKFDERSQNFRIFGNKFRAIKVKVQEAEHKYLAGLLNDREAIESASKLREETSEVIKGAPVISERDYIKAKNGVKNGESEYTEEELLKT